VNIAIPPRPSAADFERATERELVPTPRLELFDVGDEDGNIPPRQWLLGATFCRRNLSGLISAGAAGKTTVRILQALSLAAGRELTSEHVFVRSRVMIVCLEDDMTELRRRVRAAMLHHKVTPSEVKGFLILTTPRDLKIVELENERGKVVAGGLYRALSEAVDEARPRLHRPGDQGARPQRERQCRDRRFRLAVDGVRDGKKHRDRPLVA
jgi:hypothetical protein